MARIVLEREDDGLRPAFVRASFLTERGLMLERLTAVLPDQGEWDLIRDTPRAEDDFAGNASFSFGGAFLIPYANRIRGRPAPDRTIETVVGGKTVRLPANWGGKAPDAERYAMHGLILNREVQVVEHSCSRLVGYLQAGDFGVGWPSRTDLVFEIDLTAQHLCITITATNVGDERAPIGVGWHPYFQIASGDRGQARLCLAAERRLEVDDYDAVLPTGHTHPLVGSDYDFGAEDGRALGETYLDDCFVDLHEDADSLAELADPRSGVTVSLRAARPVSAIQVYAPPDHPFVCIEPQFNWADPFGDVWPEGTNTGMVWLEPGEDVRYAVEVVLKD